MLILAIITAGLCLIGWLYLTFAHGLFWLPPVFEGAAPPERWPSVDIIVPARNEAEMLPKTLPDLIAQDYRGDWRLLIVDDQSSDNTTGIAYNLATDHGRAEFLTVLPAPDLHKGWAGKPHAMQVGVAKSEAEFILFTDADIRHPKDSLTRLVARAEAKQNDLTSMMVRLNCTSLIEKLMIPAFVFFFAMIYPFQRVNSPDSGVAGAAGGVMLVRRASLDRCGGLKRIKGELIDDCALGAAIKRYGGANGAPGKVDLNLATDVESLRENPHLKDIWHMVTRTAFTQLGYSSLMLLAAVVGLGILFLAPFFVLLVGVSLAGKSLLIVAGIVSLLIMMILYLPVMQLYRLPLWWVAGLPVAATLYIVATIDSARLYWQGKGGQWKGRNQA